MLHTHTLCQYAGRQRIKCVTPKISISFFFLFFSLRCIHLLCMFLQFIVLKVHFLIDTHLRIYAQRPRYSWHICIHVCRHFFRAFFSIIISSKHQNMKAFQSCCLSHSLGSFDFRAALKITPADSKHFQSRQVFFCHISQDLALEYGNPLLGPTSHLLNSPHTGLTSILIDVFRLSGREHDQSTN